MREGEPQNLWLKICGGEVAGEIHSLTGEFVGETHKVLDGTQNHPPGNQHHKDPICLWVAEEVTESWQRAEQKAEVPSRTSLPHTAPGLPRPRIHLRLQPLRRNRCAETKKKKNGPNERTD